MLYCMFYFTCDGSLKRCWLRTAADAAAAEAAAVAACDAAPVSDVTLRVGDTFDQAVTRRSSLPGYAT